MKSFLEYCEKFLTDVEESEDEVVRELNYELLDGAARAILLNPNFKKKTCGHS